MTIDVKCESCDAFPEAPDCLASGTTHIVECPDCQRVVALPAVDNIEASLPETKPAEISVDVQSTRVATPTFEEIYGRPRGPVAALPRLQLGGPPRWAVTASVVAVLGMAAFAKKDTIVRIAPGMAPIYAALGAPVNFRGLEFRGLTSRILEDANMKVLAVEGNVVNLKPTGEKLPDMKVEVRSADGREVYSWIAAAPKKEIGPGESVYFRARLASPPAEAHDLKIHFAESGAAPARIAQK